MELTLGCPVALPSINTFAEREILPLETEIVKVVSLVVVLLEPGTLVAVQVGLVPEETDALLEIPITLGGFTARFTEDQLSEIAETILTERVRDRVGIFYQDSPQGYRV